MTDPVRVAEREHVEALKRDLNLAWEQKAELQQRLQELKEALHQWLGAYAAGYFDNIARTRRDTVREIVKTSDAALSTPEAEPE